MILYIFLRKHRQAFAPGPKRTLPLGQEPSMGYLSITALVAEPPKLLRTILFSGFNGQEKVPLNSRLTMFVYWHI
jgi:hypothetical protein